MRVVLDADGVFMHERPYWRAALATALALVGAEDVESDAFCALYGELFDARGVQRAVKRVGINSNWYLAGALVGSLEDETGRDAVVACLVRQDLEGAAEKWAAALSRYVAVLAEKRDPSGSPVAYLSRQPFFVPVIPRFQEIFHNRDGGIDIGPKYETLGDPVVVGDAFQRLRRDGADLAICTGRFRREIVEPLKEFELLDDALEASIVSHDDVERAERLSGLVPLEKPHWFPLAASVVGVECATSALCDGASLPTCGSTIFVGDSQADFGSVENARGRGLDVSFILVISGALPPDAVEEIGRASFTVGVASSFQSDPDLLRESLS